MSKQKNKGLVPELRFPEFREKGGWSFLNGNNVFDQISNKNHNSDLPILAITQEHGAIPREEIDYQVSVTDKSIESYKVVEPGDFIISLRSFQGGIEYSTYKGLCSPAYVILRKKIDVINHFFKYFFKTSIFIQSMNRNIEGIRDGKMVSYKQFSALLLPNPLPDEQQKIAACLTSVDELITAQTQKLDAFKAHKKGLMQQLFPAEGETVPKRRFPVFRDKGEWDIKPISKIGEITTGNTPSTSDKENYGGDKMFASPADISDHRFVSKTKTTLSEKGFSKTRQIPAHSILFVCIGSTIGKIAQNMYDCATNQQINSVIPFGKYVNAFVYYALDLNSSKIAELAGKQAVPIINKTLFSTVLMSMPSKKEQQKIADCLTSIDELITAQSQKIDALKAHKKGLMQQLFPSTDEVVA